MNVEVLTPKGREFQGEVESLTLPSRLGQISVLPRHAPLVSVLNPGKMKIKTATDEILKEIEGGILEISQNKAVILLKKF